MKSRVCRPLGRRGTLASRCSEVSAEHEARTTEEVLADAFALPEAQRVGLAAEMRMAWSRRALQLLPGRTACGA